MKPFLFDYKEWDMTGTMGLLPLFQEVADPAEGAGVAHDIIEHFHRGQQPCVDELMALGAIYYTRFYAGCATAQARRYGWNQSYERNTGSDLHQVFECHKASIEQYRKDDLPEPPKVRQQYGKDPDVFDLAVTEGMDGYRKEQNRDNNGEDELLHAIAGWGEENDVHRKMAGWLRYGNQQAIKRWDGKPVVSLFTAIESVTDSILKGLKEFEDTGAKVAISFSLPRRRLVAKVMPPFSVPDEEVAFWDQYSMVKSF